jgi:GntR family transcriptional regulator/MocR family aminotransferase
VLTTHQLYRYEKYFDVIIIDEVDAFPFKGNKLLETFLYRACKGNIVYMSSFSAMLLPGIRISFMVLNKELTEKYNQNAFRYAQTAGKTEQIALCSYIRDGKITSQTRKIRRIYSAKTKHFAEILKELLPDADTQIGDNTLQIVLKAKWSGDPKEFEKAGIKVFIQNYEKNEITLVISPSGVQNRELRNAAEILSQVIKGRFL